MKEVGRHPGRLEQQVRLLHRRVIRRGGINENDFERIKDIAVELQHLPFFIDYPNNGDRVRRWRAMYERVRHTSAPRGFSELTISGSERAMRDWLKRAG